MPHEHDHEHHHPDPELCLCPHSTLFHPLKAQMPTWDRSCPFDGSDESVLISHEEEDSSTVGESMSQSLSYFNPNILTSLHPFFLKKKNSIFHDPPEAFDSPRSNQNPGMGSRGGARRSHVMSTDSLPTVLARAFMQMRECDRTDGIWRWNRVARVAWDKNKR